MYCDDKTRVFCIDTKNDITPIYKTMQILFRDRKKITQLLAELIFI